MVFKTYRNALDDKMLGECVAGKSGFIFAGSLKSNKTRHKKPKIYVFDLESNQFNCKMMYITCEVFLKVNKIMKTTDKYGFK